MASPKHRPHASRYPPAQSRSFSAGTNGLVERLEASDAQVKALKSEVCRLKAVTADEERIEQNRHALTPLHHELRTRSRLES